MKNPCVAAGCRYTNGGECATYDQGEAVLYGGRECDDFVSEDAEWCARCGCVVGNDEKTVDYLVEVDTGKYHCVKCAAEIDEGVAETLAPSLRLSEARTALNAVVSAQESEVLSIPHIMDFCRALLAWAESVQEDLDERK